MVQNQLLIVETTVASEPVARRMASVLVDKKIAACVNIQSVESHYQWKGTMKADKEFLLHIKTTQERVLECIETVKKEHPYELPSILVIPVIGANKPYADWIAEYVKNRPL